MLEINLNAGLSDRFKLQYGLYRYRLFNTYSSLHKFTKVEVNRQMFNVLLLRIIFNFRRGNLDLRWKTEKGGKSRNRIEGENVVPWLIGLNEFIEID